MSVYLKDCGLAFRDWLTRLGRCGSLRRCRFRFRGRCSSLTCCKSFTDYQQTLDFVSACCTQFIFQVLLLLWRTAVCHLYLGCLVALVIACDATQLFLGPKGCAFVFSILILSVVEVSSQNRIPIFDRVWDIGDYLMVGYFLTANRVPVALGGYVYRFVLFREG